MKAIQISAPGGVEQFEEIEIEIPKPGPHEVCIQIKYAGFNPVDWKIREGWMKVPLPAILGCDCSGVVHSVGEGVSDFSPGDPVYAMSFVQGYHGSYCEYTSLPVELIFPKPEQLTFEQAAVFPLAAMTALRAVKPIARPQSTLFIAGLGGGVGSFAGQIARKCGAKRIVTVARNEKSATQIEADRIVLYEGKSTEELLDTLSDETYEGTIDLVGGAMKKLCYRLTPISGNISTLLPDEEHDLTPFLHNLSLHYVCVGAELMGPRPLWKIYKKDMQTIGNYELSPPQIQNVGPLCVESVQKAHTLLQSGRTKGKLVMQITA